MSIIDVYARAHERLEIEKTAEAYVDHYGTEDGYLPEAYFNAAVRMEKEAHNTQLLDYFAPDTGYIPAKYVGALEDMEKEAFLGAIKTFGQGMIRSGHKGMRAAGGGRVKAARDASGNIIKGSGGMQMGKNMGAGQQLRYGARKAQKWLGGKMVTNPGAVAAGGALGVGGLGYAATRE